MIKRFTREWAWEALRRASADGDSTNLAGHNLVAIVLGAAKPYTRTQRAAWGGIEEDWRLMVVCKMILV